MIYILDPSSPEENRGSFCYMPYFLYSAYARMNEQEGKGPEVVRLVEDLNITDKDVIDGIKEEDTVFIGLWSYPQIEACHILHRRIPQAKFFGYFPLIRQEGLPIINHMSWLMEGIAHYPFYIERFRHILLSDCDGHLKDRSNVFPLATSYGCVRNCSFCPVTPNLEGGKKIMLPVELVKKALCHYKSVDPASGVHFTDEDFFFPPSRAKEILNIARDISDDWGFIALASVTSFTSFLDSFSSDEEAFAFCDEVGLYLIEVGLETGDSSLAKKMGKPSFDKCVALAERIKKGSHSLKVLWLTMSLYPGETVSTLNATGSFLREYGLDPKEMSPRIRTNGTVGGLGQYFQIYAGTRGEGEAVRSGYRLLERPMRLIPSYLPSTFLHSGLKIVREWNEDDRYWLSIYGLDLNVMEEQFRNAKTVQEFLLPVADNCIPRSLLIDKVIFTALAARLGIVE